MHPDYSTSFDEHMCISPSYSIAASSQRTSTVEHLQDPNETSHSTSNRPHNHSTFGSLCSGGPPPATTPYDLSHRFVACTVAFAGQLEHNEQWVEDVGGYQNSKIPGSSSRDTSSSPELNIKTPDRSFSSPVLMYGSDRLGGLFGPSPAGAPSIGDGRPREYVGKALYEDRTIIDAQLPSIPPPLYQPNHSHQRPGRTSVHPYAFRMLPGYCGKRNDNGLLECLADCHKKRLGLRGFQRRSNLLVHLRNCHGQEIRKYDRGVLSTGASE
ncbi:hypothetical protein DFP73DRAFT_334752 [Morchella snyderi]|nr:hypothetical protein DFP73DRAFT_334752 [Morchella snyderi]